MSLSIFSVINTKFNPLTENPAIYTFLFYLLWFHTDITYYIDLVYNFKQYIEANLEHYLGAMFKYQINLAGNM